MEKQEAKNYKIGFTNKYYTLWVLSERLVNKPNGGSKVVKQYTYVKNISFDKETALASYPNVDFDEELRGKSGSFTITEYKKVEKPVYGDNVFHFGKYEGKDLYEVNNVDYTKWYLWNIERGTEHWKCVVGYIEKNGYIYMEDLNTLMTQDELDEYNKRMEEKQRFSEMFKNKTPIEFTPDKNLNKNHYCWLNDFIIVHFPEAKEMYYNGYSYCLPVLDGKAKKIKGKTIVITDYTVGDCHYDEYGESYSVFACIDVLNFTIK